MGLFGREDRTAGNQPPVAPQPGRQQAGASAPATAAASVVAQPTRIEGTILGSGDVRIEGHVKGIVDTSGQFLVAQPGVVEGTVAARNVIVAGKVVGDIAASERIELAPSARVEGDISAPRILIHDGATFDGHVVMKEPGPGVANGARPPSTTPSARRAEAASDREMPSPDRK